jgi:hypothetical protein
LALKADLSARLEPQAQASGLEDHPMHTCLPLAAALLVATAFVSPAGAVDAPRYSKALQQACASDYRRLCGEYGLGTEALRLCMDRKGKSLTRTCVNALVNSGEVSRAEVDRRK